MRPRRSALYVPGSNPRALAKSATLGLGSGLGSSRRSSLGADVLIFDLEDAVLPAAKVEARAAIAAALREGASGAAGAGTAERVLRVNGLDTPWGEDDLAFARDLPIDAVLLPKVERPETITEAASRVPALALWAMVETPRGVLALESIAAASPRLSVLVMGTSDLVKALRARHVPGRQPVLYALSKAVLVARAHGLDALDGVHLAIDDDAGFRATSEASRAMGFDGRTLIHPRTIAAAHEIYGVSAAELAQAERIIAAFREAEARGQGVCVLDGALIEKLHAEEAARIVELHRLGAR